MRSTDQAIDRFSTRLKSAGIDVAPIDGARWIDAFEHGLPKRLAPSFSSLVRRYAFAAFEWGPLFFFGNSECDDERTFPAAVLRDQTMWNTLITAGFVQFARPAEFNYDVICFDMRSPQHNGEFPIVRLDHEAILIKNRIKVCAEVSRSFIGLVEMLLTSQSDPKMCD